MPATTKERSAYTPPHSTDLAVHTKGTHDMTPHTAVPQMNPGWHAQAPKLSPLGTTPIESVEYCDACEGAGGVETQDLTRPGGFGNVKICPDCGGTGESPIGIRGRTFAARKLLDLMRRGWVVAETNQPGLNCRHCEEASRTFRATRPGHSIRVHACLTCDWWAYDDGLRG